jgi:hypothetical protein
VTPAASERQTVSNGTFAISFSSFDAGRDPSTRNRRGNGHCPTPRWETCRGRAGRCHGEPGPGPNLGNASELAALSQTDESGRYRLEDVPAGRYYIVAGRVDAPTYYPGVPGMARATALAVTAGAALADIDFVISAESARAPDRSTDSMRQYLSNLGYFMAPSVLATGRVVLDPAAVGAKIPDRITVNSRNDTAPRLANGLSLVNPSSASTRSSVAPDGTFTVTLPPGQSTLSVQGLPEGYSVKSMTSGSTDLLTQRLDVQAGMPEIVIVLTADLRPRFTLAGRVLSGTANRSLMGEQIELVGDSGSIARIIIDARGQFVFRRLLPGNYILRPASSGLNAPEQRITITNQDVTTVELNVQQ